MNILVTGSDGFIGNHLIGALLEQGHRVKGMDVHPGVICERKYEKIIADVCDKQAVENAVKGVDLIVHLAAKHHDFGISREEFFAANEGGTKNILEAATKEKIRKIVFYSSAAVYGKSEADDNTIPLPVSDYGSSKLAAENVIKNWVNNSVSNSAVVIRPTVVFGVNNFANMYNLIDKIITKKFFWIGDGSNIKSVIYIENLVAATLFLIDNMKPGYQTYNYSDEPQMTTKQMVDLISQCGNVTVPKFKIPLIIAEIGGCIMDIASKLTTINFPITGYRIKKFKTQTLFNSDKIRESGFKQPVSLADGFRKTVKWYLTQKNK